MAVAISLRHAPVTYGDFSNSASNYKLNWLQRAMAIFACVAACIGGFNLTMMGFYNDFNYQDEHQKLTG